MSRVFVAEETRLGRRVVIKVLSPDLGATLSAERFEPEVKLAARLQHPHIVPLLAAGDVGGLPYYTMPFVSGASLRERMLAGPIPQHESQGILRDVARRSAVRSCSPCTLERSCSRDGAIKRWRFARSCENGPRVSMSAPERT